MLVVVISWALFLDELMLCFLFDSDDRYYPITVVPNSYFCLKYWLSIKFYFASHGIFQILSIRIFSVVTIGSNRICLNYTEYCVMSLRES